MPCSMSFDRVLPNGDDIMPHPTSFDRVCCPKAVMSCHTRHCRPCVLSKGSDDMPRLTLPTVCAVQRWLCHATPDVVQPCVQSKEGDVMPRRMSLDCVCFPKAVMACHARRRSIVFAVHGL